MKATGLSVHELEDVMTMDRWSLRSRAIRTVLETTTNAKATGASWAYPWTVGDMSPGFGETRYGTLSCGRRSPYVALSRDRGPDTVRVSRATQQRELREMAAAARKLALTHAARYTESSLGPDARECLWALEAGLKMMPASDAGAARPRPRPPPRICISSPAMIRAAPYSRCTLCAAHLRTALESCEPDPARTTR